MKFPFSPLALLAVLTSSFAAPTETALSKRDLEFNFSLSGSLNGPISIRGVEATEDERRLSKRSVEISFTLSISNGIIAIKRGTEEADKGLSKRFEEYNVVVTSLIPENSLSGRSTDAYAGRYVVVSASDAMVQGLQYIGVTEDEMPEYFGQNLHATDPETGNTYQLVPASDSTTDDIVVNVDYKPVSQ